MCLSHRKVLSAAACSTTQSSHILVALLHVSVGARESERERISGGESGMESGETCIDVFTNCETPRQTWSRRLVIAVHQTTQRQPGERDIHRFLVPGPC